MTTRYEGSNPFDRYLSAETQQKVQELRAARNFQEIQAETHRITQEGFRLSHLHSDEWARHQRRQHHLRREGAEAAVAVEVRHRLLTGQDEQDEADDRRFGWVRCYDQLLQIRDHEDFLRASRSWERRRQRAKETNTPIRQSWTAGRIWAVGTLLLFIVLILGAAKESVLGAVILACIGAVVWALVARLPELMGDFGTTGGRGGGNAV